MCFPIGVWGRGRLWSPPPPPPGLKGNGRWGGRAPLPPPPHSPGRARPILGLSWGPRPLQYPLLHLTGERAAAGQANASRWASTRLGGWGWARAPGTRGAPRWAAAAAAGAGGCRSWRPPAGAAGLAGARPGRRAGTRRPAGPGGRRRPRPRSPTARPTASSRRAASGAGVAALAAAAARGSGCGGRAGQGPALSLRRREGPFRGGCRPRRRPRRAGRPARAPSRPCRHMEGLIASDQRPGRAGTGGEGSWRSPWALAPPSPGSAGREVEEVPPSSDLGAWPWLPSGAPWAKVGARGLSLSRPVGSLAGRPQPPLPGLPLGTSGLQGAGFA